MPTHDEQYRDRYARAEDWDCLMWAWEELPEVQANWRSASGWRKSAGGETSHAHREGEAHEILRRHGVSIESGGRPKWHFTRRTTVN